MEKYASLDTWMKMCLLSWRGTCHTSQITVNVSVCVLWTTVSHQNLSKMSWSLILLTETRVSWGIPDQSLDRTECKFKSLTDISALTRHRMIPSYPPASVNEHGNAARTDVRKRRWYAAHLHYPVHDLPPAFSTMTFPDESCSQARPTKKCPSANQA